MLHVNKWLKYMRVIIEFLQMVNLEEFESMTPRKDNQF